MAHDDEVFDVAITPDGRFAMTTCRNHSQLQLWELTTGRRMAPPVRLGTKSEVSSQTLALAPDGRRAFLGLGFTELVVVDLDANLSPSTIPAADWALLAELATAQRIEVGDLSGLTREKWQERWNSLREQDPQLVRSYVTETNLAGVSFLQIERAASRGNEFARRGQWVQSAKEALAEVAYYPEDRRIWSKAVPRLILAGDVEGYRQLCRRMVEQFRTPMLPDQAESLCKLCSLLPDAVDRSKLPMRLVTDSLEKGQVPEWLPEWAYSVLALVAYREGDFAQAVRWSEKSFDFNHRSSPSGALALAVLAMAQHRLHQEDLARQSLAEATALIPPDLATLGSPEYHGSLPVGEEIVQFDWLIAEILRREAALLIRNDAGRRLDAAALRGLGLDAMRSLAATYARDPNDTPLLLKVASLQAWYGQDAELAVTCRLALENAKDSKAPSTLERTAKACSLRPSTNPVDREAALGLARRAVKLGQGALWFAYYQMALGMAEYRSGHDAEAGKALMASATLGKDNSYVASTAGFYRAMSLFRQGKLAEARQLATEAASRMRPLPADARNPLADPNVSADDLILWLAYKEAHALLHREDTPNDPNPPLKPR